MVATLVASPQALLGAMTALSSWLQLIPTKSNFGDRLLLFLVKDLGQVEG